MDLDINNRSQATIGLRCYTNTFAPFRFKTPPQNGCPIGHTVLLGFRLRRGVPLDSLTLINEAVKSNEIEDQMQSIE